MEMKRAKQIVASPDEINVHYHGVPIWIKNCNEAQSAVSIFEKNNPEDVRIVPVKELEEV